MSQPPSRSPDSLTGASAEISALQLVERRGEETEGGEMEGEGKERRGDGGEGKGRRREAGCEKGEVKGGRGRN